MTSIGIDFQLGLGAGPVGRGHRRPDRRYTVSGTDLDEERTGDSPGITDRSVQTDGQRQARRRFIPPVRRRNRPIAGFCIRTGHGRQLTGRRDNRYVDRRPAEQRMKAILQSFSDQPQDYSKAGISDQIEDSSQAVHERALGRHGRDLAIAHRRYQHMTSGQGGTPEGDAPGINTGLATGKGDRGGPIIELACDGQQLARLTVAGTEMTVSNSRTK